MPRWLRPVPTALALCLVAGGAIATVALANAHSTTPPHLTPTVAPSPSPAEKVSGDYGGSVKVARDPAGHACCVKPASTWTVLQTRDTTTKAINISLSGILPGITLSGPITATGAVFTATGEGTVAGYPGTAVSFTGTVTPSGGLHGTLTVGANGTLPTGQSITFQVDLNKQP